MKRLRSLKHFPEIAASWRKTIHSSQWESFVPERVVDGDRGTCSHTNTQTDPWWKLELQHVYQVNTVNITYLDNQYYYWINGAVIRVGNLPDLYSNPICAEIPTIPAGQTLNFSCGGLEGRYVFVHIPGDGRILVLCEVRVYGYLAENVALWRSVSMSSQYMDWRSRYVVDGLYDSCSHTNSETDPWWSVDLLNEYHVEKVAITNRDDIKAYQRINGAVVRVGNFPNNIYSNPICATITTIPLGATVSYSCEMVGRYVIVHIPGDEKILSLCEVNVYGQLMGNLASNGTVTQSSTSGDWFAEKAIDGNRGLQRLRIGCSSTLTETNPWWRLDLSHVYRISRVVITNRNDCCVEQMNGAEIRIGNSLENNGNDNPLCAVIPAIPGGEAYSYSCGEMDGRYVNLFIPGDMKTLTLCEVEVFGEGPVFKKSLVKIMLNSRDDLTNPTIRDNMLEKLGSALVDRGFTNVTLSWHQTPEQVIQKVNAPQKIAASWQKTSQSSQYSTLAPERAVDGDRGTCSHTNTQTDPWWKLELQHVYQVNTVAITNLYNQYYCWINGAVIRVGNLADLYSNPICAEIPTIPAGQTLNFSFSFIFLEMGKLLFFLRFKSTVNLASNGTATQSSTFEDWFAEKAIDGNRGLQRLNKLTERDSHRNSLENNGNDNPICAVIPAIPGGDSYSYSCGGMDGRYLNLFIPGSKKTITLCEVEVFGEGPILKRSTVKIKLNSRHDLTNPTMRENILEKLGSALADRGFTNVTLSWYQTPQQVIQKVDAPKKNIAINGKAVQSSTLRYEANKAIDNGDLYCTHTETETNPWWRLDLLDIQIIKEVIVTNRIDCCFEQINGAEIRVGNSLENNGNSNPICAEISGIPAGQSVSYSCGEMQGRYVNVVIPGDSKNLTLCEVRVYGNDNVKLSGNAAQSSVFEYWRADRAIDGKKYAPGAASFCTHSKRETNPWWRLDLLDTYYIITVTITNRADCCPARLDGAEIRIGNSLENNGNSNPICAVVTSIPAGASYSYACLDMEGRYVNIVIPGDKILTLCEVEVSRGFPVRHFVKMKFASTSDLTGPEHDKLLFQLQSALGVRGITNVKLSWTKPPQREVERDVEVEEGPCARIQ
ncbi:hypothetical protein QQF64_031099 [Cirrhinus molitorella]|uniref:Fucolectin tachylectin-4 pentraxin-1 domain-containing protein n=1 Tax=Cirrhinus molitorella TaxID=172907 RepID=A0ABR3N5C2_9TELE